MLCLVMMLCPFRGVLSNKRFRYLGILQPLLTSSTLIYWNETRLPVNDPDFDTLCHTIV